eukprot:403748-Rhodomonas_salina.2
MSITTPDHVVVQPRRKAGEPTRRSRDPVILTQEVLVSMFHHTVPRAATELGISTTALKSACRRLGVERWPTTIGRTEFLTEKGDRMLVESPTSEPDSCHVSFFSSAREIRNKDDVCEEESAWSRQECHIGNASRTTGEVVTNEENISFVLAYNQEEVSWRECFRDLRGFFAEQFDHKE